MFRVLRLLVSAGLLGALLCLTPPVQARWRVPPRDVPIEQLEENVCRYLEAHPDDAQAYYVLGRLHAIAYARGKFTFNEVYLGGEDRLPGLGFLDGHLATFLPEPAADWRGAVRRARAPDAETLSQEDRARLPGLIRELDSEEFDRREAAQAELRDLGVAVLPEVQAALERESLSVEQRERLHAVATALERIEQGARHLRAAMEGYSRAVELDPDSGLALLGLGWCEEEAGEPTAAVEHYRRALDLGRSGRSTGKGSGGWRGGWHGLVALEAGERLLALLPAGAGEEGEASTERKQIESLVTELRAQADIGPRRMTPIVIPLEGGRSARGLEDLLDPAAEVHFDLDGDGLPGRWPWLRPNAALLVWDPHRRGRITSGWDLLGSVTWHVCWRDGYAPLSRLDDDGDGWVQAATEGRGLALWQDADGDGVSDPGEVRPLAAWGIRALGYRATERHGLLCCPEGVLLTSGEIRPSYDWVPARRR